MSLEDIFKVLADSRQQGGASPSTGQDPMTQLIGGLLGGQGGSSQAGQMADLVGGLLGGQGGSSGQANQMADLVGGLLGGQSSTPASTPAGGQGGLGDMLGLLETVIGSGQTGAASQGTSNDPIMAMLQPFINQLAEKVNISPALATIVISFVVHKILSHHPTSGRDSTQFNLDDLLSTGSLNTQTLQSSGMVKELAKATGMNEQTATRSLDAAFSLLGGTAQQVTSAPKASSKVGSAAGRKIGRSGTDQ
ncbi:MAG: hypothetical protein HYZ25_00705 [Chloroflexi bacterium]|nr:hypothetical protein [Chloroflexota bacterium]